MPVAPVIREIMTWPVVVLFQLTSFLAAALLFCVQPMIGKMVLPEFGGAPAVWNTCLVYFQFMLLSGYLLAHGAAGIETAGRSNAGFRQFCVLALLFSLGYLLQPIDFTRGSSSGAVVRNPVFELFGMLAISATVPLLVVSATAPLLQCWLASSAHPQARDPYFLYAASNTGSLASLLAYPLVIERRLSLSLQSRIWRTGFLFLAILIFLCGVIIRRFGQSGQRGDRGDALDIPAVGEIRDPIEKKASVSKLNRARWVVLAFISSSWLLAITTYLTTDLAAIPLLWAIPLSIYLSSFVLAFGQFGVRAAETIRWLLPYLAAILALVMSAGFTHAIWIPLHLATFFAGCVACHSSLARNRPSGEHAGRFYVAIAIGGLLGGLFTTLVAPLVFNRVVEYPLAVILALVASLSCGADLRRPPLREVLLLLLLPGSVFLLTAMLAMNLAGLAESAIGVLAIVTASGLGLLATITARRRPLRFALCLAAVLAASALASGIDGQVILRERSFFGVVRVTHDPKRNVHRLFHGTTQHGQQFLDPALAREPSTYYTRSGPFGRLIEAIRPRFEGGVTEIAILGLGVGTLASYARPGERWTFFEIDPVIARIAGDRRFFTYLADCRAKVLGIELGDARMRLRRTRDHAFRLIVLDVFSSDSLPVHLFSREAIKLYRLKLAAGGVIAFNLSNRYLDLEPVLGRQAIDVGLVCRIAYDVDISPEQEQSGKEPSIWAILVEDEDDLGELARDSLWRQPRLRDGSAVWTDDFSDPTSYMSWLPRWYRRIKD